MGRFVHLHLHSEYSLLDGACRIADIPLVAKEQGQEAVAITDHGVLYGAVDFWRACKAERIKAIIGCEVYVAPRDHLKKEGKQDISGHHLVLLCENEIGYHNLMQLVSLSHVEGFYMKPRVDMELLRRYHEGLIALSACVAGEVPRLILTGDYEVAKKKAIEYRDVFGQNNYYLEIQDHDIPDEKRVAASLSAISKETGIPLVATNDVHYLRRRDSEMQATLMCIQTNTTLTEGKPLGFETDEFYFKSTQEMERMFSMYPGATENTALIADRCHFDFTFGELHLPSCPVPSGKTHKDVLTQMTLSGFDRLVREGKITFDRNSREEYIQRIHYELDVIDTMGFSAYFLIVQDFVNYSKTHGISVGPGRGSGAGSLVAYCIGITDVDSIRYDLLFERFLNPERQSMPDFDIDFCYENRDRAIAYVREKYGDDHVAQIITFGTLAARAAVRDVGRAMGMSYGDVDAVAKLIPTHLPLKEAVKLREINDLYEGDPNVQRLLDMSMAVEGMPRHASTHAAGIVITEKSVSHYVPLAMNGDVIVTQFDMDTVAKLGLIKFDFLGLRYLTIMDRAESEIRKTNPGFTLGSIPFDDPVTYRMISQGRTEGVFQLESGGIRRVLSEMKPSCFEDIVATIALYRPGPMDSIDTFIARKLGMERVEYSTPLLAPILNYTYGCIVYQEQVMQIFRSLAGYSYARADLVRRAMSKKKADEMAREKDDFIRGALERGVSSRAAEEIFADMESFASYAFNRSHATAYAMISYRTAYLKAHYPAEYLAALMSCGVSCDPARFDVRVLPPDVNASTMDFSAANGQVRYGFLAIKNVGKLFIDALLNERKRGAFRSFEDFIDRMAGADLNRRQIESMIKCGVFDSLGVYRSRLMAVYDELISRAVAKAHENVTGQMDLFGLMDDAGVPQGAVEYPQIPEYPKKDLLAFEKEITGFYFSGSLFDGFRHHADTLSYTSIAELQEAFDENGESQGELSDRDKASVVGIVASTKVKTTKRGEDMAFITLEDVGGSMEIIAFPKQYSAYGRYLSLGTGVYIEGEITVKEGEKAKLILSRLTPLLTNEEFDRTNTVAEATPQKQKTLYLKVPSVESSVTKTIQMILKCVPGNSPVVFYDEGSGKYMKAGGQGVDVSEQLLNDLSRVMGEENVVWR